MGKFFVFLFMLGLFSCPYIGEEEPIDAASKYKPIILKREDFEKSVALKGSMQIEKSAKIYVFKDFIFINDKNKGFHIFNNKDATKPKKEKFLKVLGATDIAIKNNTLYINQATDLIVLTFNPSDYSYKIEKRMRNVFPQKISPDGFRFHVGKNEIIIDWILK